MLDEYSIQILSTVAGAQCPSNIPPSYFCSIQHVSHPMWWEKSTQLKSPRPRRFNLFSSIFVQFEDTTNQTVTDP